MIATRGLGLKISKIGRLNGDSMQVVPTRYTLKVVRGKCPQFFQLKIFFSTPKGFFTLKITSAMEILMQMVEYDGLCRSF